MRYSKATFASLSAVLLAFTAPSEAWTRPSVNPLLLAQSPEPTRFPLPSALPTGSTLKVDGSTSMSVINEALKQQFQQQFPGTTVDLAASRTDEALQALLNGKLDLVAVGRPLTDAEKAEGLVEVPISREKVAIIVGPDNPFNGDITFEQFAKIFRGEITDWSELGGPAGPIRVIDRPDYSDTRLSLSRYNVFQNAPFQPGATAEPVEQDDTVAVVQALGKDGIGYAIASQVTNQANVKIIPMHQTLPTDPRYPYSQPRGYVYKASADGTLNPVVTAFLGLATSASGQAAVAAAKTTEANTVSQASTANPAPDTTSASPSPAASPLEAQTAQVPSSDAVAETKGSFPWWLLLLPLIGGLLWWWKGRKPAAVSEAVAAPTPVAAGRTSIAKTALDEPPAPPRAVTAPPSPPSAIGGVPAAGIAATGAAIGAAALGAAALKKGRIILTPRSEKAAYAYWEIPKEQLAAAREKGGEKLMLRLYDVTDTASDQAIPHSVKQFNCNPADPDLHVPIEFPDRDYVAELGYVTSEGQWLKLLRSNPVRVPAAPVAAALGATALAAGAIGAAAGTAVSAEATPSAAVIAPSHLTLAARGPNTALAQWDVPEAAKANAKRQGGHTFQLRLYDAAHPNFDQQPADSVQSYDIDEQLTERLVSLPRVDRHYIAEVGYVTEEGHWLALARSNPIHVAAAPTAPTPPISDTAPTPPLAVGAAIAAGAGAAALAGAAQPAVDSAIPTTGNCAIAHLRVHSLHNCYLLNATEMQRIQDEIAVNKFLEPGQYLIRIKSGQFAYAGAPASAEPLVLLWIYGGKVMNQKTNTPVASTWSSLNGYDETLNLEVLEPATLCAFFFDTYLDDNDSAVTLSVVKL